MQEEENKAADPQADQPVAEDSAEGQAPAEAQAPEAAEEQAPEEAQEAAAAEEASPAEEAPAAEAAPEPAEQVSPKQRRRTARSRASGEARPQRSVEERAQERLELRRRKGSERSRWRAKQREKKGRDGESAAAGLPDAPPSEPGKRKVRQGVVVSSKADKTITVRIDMIRRHRVYGKVVRASGTLHAHDENNQAGEGDVVRVVESRPLSRMKRWRLVEVLEKAR
jgi:small subunit ribosomal protein S17